MRNKARKIGVSNKLETLESRQLMSASLVPTVTQTSVNGALDLNVVITGGEDVTVTQSSKGVTIGCYAPGWGNTFTMQAPQTYAGSFAEILVSAVSGNNLITISSSVTTNTVVQGGSGNDTIQDFGVGHDTLYAGTGHDILQAGTGADTLIAVGTATDTLMGGSGMDSFWDTSADTLTRVTAAETSGGTVHTLASAITTSTLPLSEPTIGLSGTSYKSFAADPLFAATGPSANDIVQGSLGDCYFLATLSAFAQTAPQSIQQDVVQLSDGTFLARFFSGGKAVYEHVDATLPVNSSGKLVYAQLGTGNSLWVAIEEKAFAVFRNGADSYANIASGWMSEVYTDLGVVNYNSYFSASASAMMSLIQSEVQSGDAVTVGILTPSAGTPLIGDHAYSVVGVVTNSSGVITGLELRNPWGTVGVSGYAANGGYVTVTPAQAFAAIEGVTAGVA